jgi:hypothetical protein
MGPLVMLTTGNLRDGPPPGDGAVVDARGAVHGIDRLWVADASVMPAIPRREHQPDHHRDRRTHHARPSGPSPGLLASPIMLLL